ncbi:DUF305 domain-containing protein [Streptosporangium sp. NPDC087985]|uniref:DUF305 domain-containing protein n=1 Tax=Streptosporangium sp. NPDC087985 TaxID=3366196 RepID=UPI00380C9E0D
MVKRVVPIVLGVLLLAGCGAPGAQELRGDAQEAYGAARTPRPASGADEDFNYPDVMFLQMMAVHNRQGVELVGLAPERAARQEVKTLAAAIATTQEAEAASMTDRLIGWGQPVTPRAGQHAAHGGMSPEMTKVAIAAIADAAPADFEHKLLNMLIAQQDDAIQMARMEAVSGWNPEVRALAARIEVSRAAQIKQMLALLGQ